MSVGLCQGARLAWNSGYRLSLQYSSTGLDRNKSRQESARLRPSAAELLASTANISCAPSASNHPESVRAVSSAVLLHRDLMGMLMDGYSCLVWNAVTPTWAHSKTCLKILISPATTWSHQESFL